MCERERERERLKFREASVTDAASALTVLRGLSVSFSDSVVSEWFCGSDLYCCFACVLCDSLCPDKVTRAVQTDAHSTTEEEEQTQT